MDKLEKIREIEYDLDRIRSLIERVDERANGVMYASGALALFYVTLLTLITNRDICLEVADHSPFVVLLFFSSFCSMLAFVWSIVSIYPIPYNVGSVKDGDGTSDKLKILEFRYDNKMEIKFEPKLKRIGKPKPIVSAKSCQNMNVDEILYFKCATLHGQKLAVVRKYNWLRMALIFLTVSVVSLFLIAILYLILKFIPGLVSLLKFTCCTYLTT